MFLEYNNFLVKQYTVILVVKLTNFMKCLIIISDIFLLDITFCITTTTPP